MDGETRYSNGDLAQRTGLTVKTIRFYSDRGIVPPTDRGPTGQRHYGLEAVARLDLVRTLREPGVDLSTIRKVVDRDQLGPALAAGVDPTSPRADPIVATVTGRYAQLCGRPDDLDLRRLLVRLESANDPRRERHLHLLSVINGWSPTESLAPVLDWSIRALRARTSG